MSSVTSYRRPIVNSRDESLCGRNQGGMMECARLDGIFFDNTLAHVASLLKDGRHLAALKLQLLFLEDASRFVADGNFADSEEFLRANRQQGGQ